jgi:hypothetical protein
MGCGNSSEQVQEMKPRGGKEKGGAMQPGELPQQEIKKIQEKEQKGEAGEGESEQKEEGMGLQETKTPPAPAPPALHVQTAVPSPPPPPPQQSQKKKQEKAGEIIANNLSMALQTKKLSKIQLEKQNEV